MKPLSICGKPFVKMAGGKRRLLPELLKRVPEKIDVYVEPFVGGGALFFELARQKRFRVAVIGDANKDLIDLYRAVRNCSVSDSGAFVKEMKSVERSYLSKDVEGRAQLYYRWRNENPSPVRTLFLNKTCFNGLWRVNSKGKFNVPHGKYKSPKIYDAAVIEAASQALRGVRIIRGDFEWIGSVASSWRRRVVYCDPPYDCEFTAYTSGWKGWEDQERLAAWPYWDLVSNADTPRIRKLYKGHKIEVVRMPRAINSNGSGRGEVNELLITRRR